MATRTGKSATNGDWTDITNWEEGAAPANGDDVYIRAGSANWTTNLNQAAVTLASLNVEPGYTGSIGSSGTRLIINATTVSIKLGANVDVTNNLWLTLGSSTRLFVECPNASQQISITSSGTITDSLLRMGTITLESGTFTNVWAYGNENTSTPDDNLSLTIATATITNLHNKRGQPVMTGAGTITNFYQYSPAADCDIQAGTVTNYWCIGTGTVRHKTTSTTTNVYALGGTFSAVDDSRAKTITNAYLAPGAVMDLRNGPNNITVTNGVKTLTGQTSPYYTALAA